VETKNQATEFRMPVGNVGAIVGARRARERTGSCSSARAPRISEGEIAHREQVKAEAQLLKQVMMKYDSDHSGKLERNELSVMLQDFDFTKKIPPSEDEINFIISLADEKTANAGGIDLRHLKPALQEWNGYLKVREPMVTAFHEYDVSRTGKLEPAELKEYLKTVNGSKQITDKDVHWVMSKADISRDGACSSPSELYLATKSWSERRNKLNRCVLM